MNSSGGFDYLGVSFGMALADFDRDGDLDAVVASMEEPYKLYRNQSSSFSSITIRLLGRKEMNGGSDPLYELPLILVHTGEMYPLLRAMHPPIHQSSIFGLGKAKQIKEIEITWPTGEIQTLSNVSINAHHQISQPENPKPLTNQEVERSTIFRGGLHPFTCSS